MQKEKRRANVNHTRKVTGSNPVSTSRSYFKLAADNTEKLNIKVKISKLHIKIQKFTFDFLFVILLFNF
jgi:hypothetical protein